MSKDWQIASRYSDDLIEQLLFNRGIKLKEEKEKFFRPQLADFSKDLGITGLEKARKRILKAIENKELIIVFGDYDVDGVCGTAVLYLGLTARGAKVLPYIPHREKEGYGLSAEGLQYAQDQGAKLVITVDNGIVAIKSAQLAKKLGLELIITDHHLPLEEKPEALAIVHSTKICGAAVGWCLVRSLQDSGEAEELLDLVALATVSDMMPLLGVNRALVKVGLQKLACTKRVGLKALITESGLFREILTSYHLGHVLGPRLNAKGRLEHAMDSVRLLCTKDLPKAKALAKVLNEANDQRKSLVAQAVLEAKNSLEKDVQKVIVLDSKSWIPGIVGLVAGRLMDEYSLTVVIISRGDEFSKGSALSIKGVNIIEAIRRFSNLLVDVGGHPQAAGFTIETAKIAEFKSKLELALEKTERERRDTLSIEATVPAFKLTKQLAQNLTDFEPVGIGNPQPVLASYSLKVSDLRAVGGGQHLKLKLNGIEAIAFSFGKLASFLKEGQLVDVAYHLEINQFCGRESLQLKVLDVKY